MREFSIFHLSKPEWDSSKIKVKTNGGWAVFTDPNTNKSLNSPRHPYPAPKIAYKRKTDEEIEQEEKIREWRQIKYKKKGNNFNNFSSVNNPLLNPPQDNYKEFRARRRIVSSKNSSNETDDFEFFESGILLSRSIPQRPNKTVKFARDLQVTPLNTQRYSHSSKSSPGRCTPRSQYENHSDNENEYLFEEEEEETIEEVRFSIHPTENILSTIEKGDTKSENSDTNYIKNIDDESQSEKSSISDIQTNSNDSFERIVIKSTKEIIRDDESSSTEISSREEQPIDDEQNGKELIEEEEDFDDRPIQLKSTAINNKWRRKKTGEIIQSHKKIFSSNSSISSTKSENSAMKSQKITARSETENQPNDKVIHYKFRYNNSTSNLRCKSSKKPKKSFANDDNRRKTKNIIVSKNKGDQPDRNAKNIGKRNSQKIDTEEKEFKSKQSNENEENRNENRENKNDNNNSINDIDGMNANESDERQNSNENDNIKNANENNDNKNTNENVENKNTNENDENKNAGENDDDKSNKENDADKSTDANNKDNFLLVSDNGSINSEDQIRGKIITNNDVSERSIINSKPQNENNDIEPNSEEHENNDVKSPSNVIDKSQIKDKRSSDESINEIVQSNKEGQTKADFVNDEAESDSSCAMNEIESDGNKGRTSVTSNFTISQSTIRPKKIGSSYGHNYNDYNYYCNVINTNIKKTVVDRESFEFIGGSPKLEVVHDTISPLPTTRRPASQVKERFIERPECIDPQRFFKGDEPHPARRFFLSANSVAEMRREEQLKLLSNARVKSNLSKTIRKNDLSLFERSLKPREKLYCWPRDFANFTAK